MDQERTSSSTHAIMEKVRELDLYPVVADEGKYRSSMRLARAMEIAYRALQTAATARPALAEPDPARSGRPAA